LIDTLDWVANHVVTFDAETESTFVGLKVPFVEATRTLSDS
jgi:hypothetical protein